MTKLEEEEIWAVVPLDNKIYVLSSPEGSFNE